MLGRSYRSFFMAPPQAYHMQGVEEPEDPCFSSSKPHNPTPLEHTCPLLPITLGSISRTGEKKRKTQMKGWREAGRKGRRDRGKEGGREER